MARGEAKARICETAVRLFNERGYEAVSLRQIAAEANTTIGNLTYHFARKEDLLSTVLIDLHMGFSERLDRTLSGVDLMRRLVELFNVSEKNHEKYPFYFDNLSQLMVAAPSLREENDAFAKELLDYYAWAFTALREQGFLDERNDDEVVGALAYALVTLQSGWTQASSPHRNALLPSPSITSTLCVLLRTHFSSAHVAEFDAVCKAACDVG